MKMGGRGRQDLLAMDCRAAGPEMKSVLPISVVIVLAILVVGWLVMRVPRVEVGMTELDIDTALGVKASGAWGENERVSGKIWATESGDYVIEFDDRERASEIIFRPKRESLWNRLRNWLGW